MSALRLSDVLINLEPCPADASFPRWFALLDAHGRWVRPGTPTDGCRCPNRRSGNGCAGTRQEVLAAEARLTLTVTRSHPVRELRSAQAAAAGCDQLKSDRVAEFSRPIYWDERILEPISFRFSGPVRFCVYRVSPDQPVERQGLGDFVRGGVLSPERGAALQQHLRAPRAGAQCVDGSTLFVWLTNAEDRWGDGDVGVQLDGCRQMLIELKTGSMMLARADPALVALLSTQ
jgi:hypothetical protein